jgi:hypothetical protein
MSSFRRSLLVSLVPLLVAACGDNLTAAPADAGAAGDVALPDFTVTLPQLVGGAATVNPAVYESVPLRIVVAGPPAASVAVRLGETTVDAADAGDGAWVATLPLLDLVPGVVTLAVTAQAADGRAATAAGELVVQTEGNELTVWTDVGRAGTPRLLKRDGRLYLTWSDRRLGTDEAFIAPVDGAGRFLADPAPLVGGSDPTLYVRTAFGAQSIAVLYQGLNQPYRNRFKLVDYFGQERLAPIALDPEDGSGTFGGAVVYDGSGFVAVWRVTRGDGLGEVRWLRVDEATRTVTGPVPVAVEGDGTAVGGFAPFSFVAVAAVGDVSVVGFVRAKYHALLDYLVPKSQYAVVASDGTVGDTVFAGLENDFTWHREARVWANDDGFVCVWSASDLASSEDQPPYRFYAARADAAGALNPARGSGTPMFDAPDDRDEPFLLLQPEAPPTPEGLGTLAWTDNRSYTLDPTNGHITLTVAPVAANLTTVEPPTTFAHARFFEGLSELHATAAGTNAILVWIDDRHSNGIFDPRPEVYLDTAWY